MTTFTISDARNDYDLTISCGKVAQVVRRRAGSKVGEIVEWDDLPFLVQASVESRLNQMFDGVPSDLFKR